MSKILTEILEHLKAHRAPYIVGGFLSLSTFLFLIIWRGWLSERLAHTTEAIPRQVLLAVIGLLVLWLLASVVVIAVYARELSTLQKSSPSPKEIALEPNDVLILKIIAASETSIEPKAIATITGFHLTVVQFHLHRLTEAKYLHRYQGWYSLEQKAREYLIKNKLI